MYGLVLSPGFLRATKNALFLNLLYRSLKRCEAATAAALAKRVLQSALLMPANMAAALLVVVSAAMAERGGLPREQIDGLEEIPAEIAVEGGLERRVRKASEDEDERRRRRRRRRLTMTRLTRRAKKAKTKTR